MKKYYYYILPIIKPRFFLGFTAIFICGLTYGILIGKYQFPPYNFISDIKTFAKSNYDISTFEYLESISPKGQLDKLKSNSDKNAIKNTANVIDSVLTSVLPEIYKSQKSTPDFTIELPSLIGYTVNHSVTKGDNLPFYIHNTFDVVGNIYSLGRKKILVKTIGPIKPYIQSNNYSPIKGFEWNPSFVLDSKELDPGYYLIELVNAAHGLFQIPFIVKSQEAKRISFIAGVNTWDAYNNYAKKSFYLDSQSIASVKEFNLALNKLLKSNNADPLPIHLPNARPFMSTSGDVTDELPEEPHYSHHVRGEWTLLGFAAEHDIEHSIFTDRDLKFNGKVFDSDIIVFNVHSQYWTNEMKLSLEEYISKGGKVVFAGGNNIFKEVKYNDFGIELIHSYTQEDISPVIGTYFTGKAIPTYASFKVENSKHWVFKDTGLKNGDEFAQTSSNHRPEESVQGASGWEADQTSIYSVGFEVIAKGTNKYGGAHMVFKDTSNGGWVFNASSIPFTGALFSDTVVSQIMLNLLTSEAD